MKQKGFTLVELIVAITVFSIFLTIIFGVFGQIYFKHKKILVDQNFQSEMRLLMEKIVKLTRENTIDYDRYFIEIGPDSSNCASFAKDQIPLSFEAGWENQGSKSLQTNSRTNREKIGYENVFFWDTTADGHPDRNLGGFKPNDNDNFDDLKDNCTQAFHKTTITETKTEIPHLFLINKDRTRRYDFKLENSRISLQTELSTDTDNDGIADTWSASPIFSNSQCEISSSPILGEATDEKFCYSAHDFASLSLENVTITSFDITITPDTDPYLAFRIDEKQNHPLTTIVLKGSLESSFAERKGFESDNIPTAHFQTSVSSRIFGNIRE